jgi:CHAD domain-containing protein
LISEVQAARENLLSRDPEAIHEARKHLKKARSALRLLRGIKPRHPPRNLRHALRDIARRLSRARDREVVDAWLEHWRQTTRIAAERKLALKLQRQLTSSGGSHIDQQPNRRAVIARLRQVIRQLEALDVANLDWKAINANVEHSRRRMRKAEKTFAATSALADLHAWRKRSKDLWYQLRLLRPRLRRDLRQLPRALRTLTETQGKLHDLDVLQKLLQQPLRKLSADQRSLVEKRIAGEFAHLLLALPQGAKPVRKLIPRDLADALNPALR